MPWIDELALFARSWRIRIVAGRVGEADVADHQVEALHGHQIEGVPDAAGGADVMPAQLEEAGEQLRGVLVILDD